MSIILSFSYDVIDKGFGITIVNKRSLYFFKCSFVARELVEHAIALLVSPIKMALFEDIEPWLSHGMMDRLWMGLMYNWVEKDLASESYETSVSRKGNVLLCGASRVNWILSFRLFAMVNSRSADSELDKENDIDKDIVQFTVGGAAVDHSKQPK